MIFECIAQLNEHIKYLAQLNDMKVGVIGTFTDGQKVILKGKYLGKSFWNPYYVRWECPEMKHSASNWGSLFTKGLVELTEQQYNFSTLPKVK